MSSRYADGKRKSSMVHANRGWKCPCGRTVYGNGGKSGHQRSCPTWAERVLATAEKNLAEIEAGTFGGGNLMPHTVREFRQRYEQERDEMRARLAKADR